MTDHTQDCTGANPIEFKVKPDVEQIERVAEEMAEALKRAAVMLRATSSFVTENPVKDYSTFYDEAECDGTCLRDDCDTATLDVDAALASYAKWKEMK